MFTDNQNRYDGKEQELQIFPLLLGFFFMIVMGILAFVFRKNIRAYLIEMQERREQQQFNRGGANNVGFANNNVQMQNMDPALMITATTAQHGDDQPLTNFQQTTTPMTLGDNQLPYPQQQQLPYPPPPPQQQQQPVQQSKAYIYIHISFYSKHDGSLTTKTLNYSLFNQLLWRKMFFYSLQFYNLRYIK